MKTRTIHPPALSVLLPVLAVLSCCNGTREGYYISLAGPTQGTSFHISYLSADSIVYQEAVESLLHEFDTSLSTYLPSSLISRFNRGSGGVKPDSFLLSVYGASRDIWEETGGAFDITVAPVVNAWGFGFTDPVETDSALIDSLLRYVGMEKVRLENGRLVKDTGGVMLDVNAIAQGYAVDVVSEFLESKGIRNYLVEIGGEVRALGRNSRGEEWRVGIDKPIEGLQVPGLQMEAVVALSGASLATSGNYRRYYEKNGVKYAHTIDPATGYPVQHNLLSASVLAQDCMTADGYATAFMVLGFEKSRELLASHDDLEACLIYNDDQGRYKVYCTKGMKKLIRN